MVAHTARPLRFTSLHFQEIILYYYIITVNIAIGSINRKEQ